MIVILLDAMSWLVNFRQQLDVLRQRERTLQENLRIFEINLADSLELIKIEKVLLYFISFLLSY